MNALTWVDVAGGGLDRGEGERRVCRGLNGRNPRGGCRAESCQASIHLALLHRRSRHVRPDSSSARR